MVSKLRKSLLAFIPAVVVLVLLQPRVARLLHSPLEVAHGERGLVRGPEIAAPRSQHLSSKKQLEDIDEHVHTEAAKALWDEIAGKNVGERTGQNDDDGNNNERLTVAGEEDSVSYHKDTQHGSLTSVVRDKLTKPVMKSPAMVSSLGLDTSGMHFESESAARVPERLRPGAAAKFTGRLSADDLHSSRAVPQLQVHEGEQIHAAHHHAIKTGYEGINVSLKSSRNNVSSSVASSRLPSMRTAGSSNVGESVVSSGERADASARWRNNSSRKIKTDRPVSRHSGGCASPQCLTPVDRMHNSSVYLPVKPEVFFSPKTEFEELKKGQQAVNNTTRTGLFSTGHGGTKMVTRSLATLSSRKLDGDATTRAAPTIGQSRGDNANVGGHATATAATTPGNGPEVPGASGAGAATEGHTDRSSSDLAQPYVGFVGLNNSHFKILDRPLTETVTRVAKATTVAIGTSGQPSSGQLTMDALAFTDRLFLISAYSDFRKSPPSIKIVIYAAKGFDETVYCVRGGAAYPAALSWINYPSEELAVWRAGYLECVVPGLTERESTVELSRDAGSPGARLPLRHSPPAAQRSAFGLCVKSGYGAPSAVRFVEWMELHALLGVEHVVLYDLNLSGPILSAMQFYVDSGRLTVVKDNSRRLMERSQPDFVRLFAGFDATHATGNEPYAQLELLSIQDCFHRFRGDYEYIIVADIDEAIVPVNVSTMPDLVQVLKRKAPAATSFSHMAAAYLPHFAVNRSAPLSNGSGHAYMLTHTRRTPITWDGSKAFHSTADTDSLNWHKRIHPSTRKAYVDPEDAWLHHYRGSCKGSSCDANASTADDGATVMGRFAMALSSRALSVMSTLWPP